MARWISVVRRSLLSAFLAGGWLSVAPSAGAAEPEIDPCRLVTKQEAAVVLGAAVASENSPPARPGRSVRICSIRGGNGRTLTVFVGPRTKAAFDQEKKGHPQVSGIGDDAYANPPGVVAVRKGETVLLLSMSLDAAPDEAGLLERMKTLARAGIGRL